MKTKISALLLAQEIENGLTLSAIAIKYNVNIRTIERKRARIKAGSALAATETFFRAPRRARIYVITAAQNATQVHRGFLSSLELYCKHRRAELVVIPIRYKNPTGRQSFNELEDWWSKDVKKYLCESRFYINDNIVVMADIKTQPTAVDPLAGLESVGADKSVIFAHTSLALRTVPVSTGSMPKIIATTGACTERNYSDTKAGKKGEFNHSFSALVVETTGKQYHLRQLSATKDGSFIDLAKKFSASKIEAAGECHLVLGDWHDFARDPGVVAATFTSPRSIIKTLNPATLVWHDSFDFMSRNHHHRGNPFVNYAKHASGIDNVKQELAQMFRRIETLAGGRLSVFPYSNHPAALERWIKEADWKTDPVNAEFYLETALAMIQSTKMAGHKSVTVDPFAYWGGRLLREPANFLFLGPRDSHDILGVKVDMHGHLGPNGSRGGTAKQFSRLGVKTITGHGHGAAIFHGAYRVGTSSRLDLEYNSGPSSWLQTHCVIYSNGKRSLINIINGKWNL